VIGAKLLIIGAGIGGLTSAFALRGKGFDVDMIERDPDWSVYGVGIIQQANVIRAMKQLGLLDDYLHAAFGFDEVDVFLPNGAHIARIPSPKLVDGYPANVGISRKALHTVLGDRALAAGATIRLGITAARLADGPEGVTVTFSDGTSGHYDAVIGADGVNSMTREAIFPDAPEPEFTGQGVWRYNFSRPADVTTLMAFEGQIGAGVVPLAADLMYLFVTTPEPENRRYARDGLADVMRSKVPVSAPFIADLAAQIIDDDGVVYKPLETIFLPGPWHKGRIVLLGDAVHSTTPHLGQGAGMAIEDSIVLADELSRASDFESAFAAYRERRFERCRYIVESSLAICRSQLGQGPRLDQAKVTQAMFKIVAEAI
jgi:2-polyprenyl-6-methoxyphenol hydroxylase-like FAD-dependent oxidoreductase